MVGGKCVEKVGWIPWGARQALTEKVALDLGCFHGMGVGLEFGWKSSRG